MAKQKVVIVGGGFAGVKAALELCDDQEHFEVTLISDQKDFQYHPSLYHTATGGASAESSIPLENIFAGKQVIIMLDSVETLDREKHIIHTKNGLNTNFDVLIVALGMVTNYFHIDGLEQFSYGMKSMAEVRELKAHIHKQLSDEHAADPNYVIVGGGPTGVELAGALPEYLDHVTKNHGIQGKNWKIDLIEASPKLVPRLPDATGKAIAKRLTKLGVTLYLGAAVQGETADALMVSGRPLNTHTVIWTAGITNNPFFKANNFKMTDKGKVIVDEHLEAEHNILVLGDNAETKYSGMAQTAVYDAIFVAENLHLAARGQAMKPYVPKLPVYVTPVGRDWASVVWKGIEFNGWIGAILRSAANWIAYHDMEPWWPATKEWMTEFEKEEDCPACNKAGAKAEVPTPQAPATPPVQ